MALLTEEAGALTEEACSFYCMLCHRGLICCLKVMEQDPDGAVEVFASHQHVLICVAAGGSQGLVRRPSS